MKLNTRIASFLLIINTIYTFSVQAQKTLFSIDGKGFDAEQFEYLYAKNNQTETDLYTKASVDEYLELFINLKLKVIEAEELGLHKEESFIKELAQYRQQIAQTYLIDKNVTDELVKEAYERSKKEINCAHILVSCAQDAFPADSLLAYQKAVQLKQRIENGEDFFKLAKESSDDPSALQNNGKLGFSSVFRFIYEFENAMYNTPVGKVSQPVRTQYGYHLINVMEERPSKGLVNVSQIKLDIPVYGQTDIKTDIKVKMDSVYQLISAQKYTFEKAAMDFSDDSATNRRGGNLGWLSAGKKGEKFDQLIFDLPKDAITQPIQIGNAWYIFKLNEKKPIDTYENSKEELRSKVERNSRSHLAKDVFVQKLKNDYNFKEQTTEIAQLSTYFNQTLLLGKWIKNPRKEWDKKLFFANNTHFTLGQFADFVMQNQQKERITQFDAVVNKFYQNFVAQELIKIEDSYLEQKYPAFARLVQEFYDGILMFELTSQKVFQQSVADTVGQKVFYAKNAEKYKWNERLDAKKFRCSSPDVAKQAREQLKIQDDDLVYANFNKDGKINIKLVKEAKFERGEDEIIDAIDWETGVSRIIEHRDGNYYLVKAKGIVTTCNKTFEEAKSEVINDFQTELSEKMIANIKAKHDIKIDNKVLKKLYK